MPFDKALRGMENRLRRFGSELAGIGSKMMVGGGAALAPAIFSVKEFAAFDDQIKAMSAVVRKAATPIDEIIVKIKELAGVTSYTATEVATAAKLMAKGGFDTSALNNSISSVLNLAKATETDLPRAAEIVTKMLNAFAIPKDLENIEHFMDQLVHTTNSSSQSLEDLFENLKNFAPQAGMIKLSTEEALAFSGALADAGLSGTLAGTQIRRVLTNLANSDKSSVLKDMFDIDVAKNGKMRNIVEIIKDLKKALSGPEISDKDQLNALETIFEVRGMGAIQTILKRLDAVDKISLQDFIKELETVDSVAKNTAASMMESFGNRMLIVVSALSKVKLAIGEALAEPLLKLGDVVSVALVHVSNFVKEHHDFVRSLVLGAAALAAAGAAFLAFGAVAMTVAAVIGSIKLIGLALISPFLMAFHAIVYGVTKVIAAFEFLGGTISSLGARVSGSGIFGKLASSLMRVTQAAGSLGRVLSIVLFESIVGVIKVSALFSRAVYDSYRALILVIESVNAYGKAYKRVSSILSNGANFALPFEGLDAAVAKADKRQAAVLKNMQRGPNRMFRNWFRGLANLKSSFSRTLANIGRSASSWNIGGKLKAGMSGFVKGLKSLGKIRIGGSITGAIGSFLKFDLIINAIVLSAQALHQIIKDMSAAFVGFASDVKLAGESISLAFDAGLYTEMFEAAWAAAQVFIARISSGFGVIAARAVNAFLEIKTNIAMIFSGIYAIVAPFVTAISSIFSTVGKFIASSLGFDMGADYAQAASDTDRFFDTFMGKLAVAATAIQKFGRHMSWEFESLAIRARAGEWFSTHTDAQAKASAAEEYSMTSSAPFQRRKKMSAAVDKMRADFDATGTFDTGDDGDMAQYINNLKIKNKSRFDSPEKRKAVIEEAGGVQEWLRQQRLNTQKTYLNEIDKRAKEIKGQYVNARALELATKRRDEDYVQLDTGTTSMAEDFARRKRQGRERVDAAKLDGDAMVKDAQDKAKAVKTKIDQKIGDRAMRVALAAMGYGPLAPGKVMPPKPPAPPDEKIPTPEELEAAGGLNTIAGAGGFNASAVAASSRGGKFQTIQEKMLESLKAAEEELAALNGVAIALQSGIGLF